YLRDPDGPWMQPHWVGDLTISTQLTSSSSAGRFRIGLVEGGVLNLCEIDLATGEAILSHGDTVLGKADTTVIGQGTHDLTLANVDNRLTLWVDGSLPFGDGLTYEDPPESHPEPTVEDLQPARLSVKGAEVAVSRLVLKRDIYYTQKPGSLDFGNAWDSGVPRSAAELFDWLSQPEKVAAIGPLTWSDYEIGDDRYMMMGDNSPRSQDSRGWNHRDVDWDSTGRRSWEVPGSMLTGKAFCVYWPHGKPFGPDVRPWLDFQIPFRPYFERMGLIR
ncbi:MAG: signal peptidase I, partial [Isosphaeraceae bacterium]